VIKTRFGCAGTFLLASALLLGGCVTTGTSSGDSNAELQTSSDQTSTQKRAVIRLQLAVGYYQRGELDVALDEVKQSLQANPDFADAYNMRGLIYMQMGENHLAEDNFQHALRLAPHNGEADNNYGWFLCQNSRISESFAYFEAAVAERKYPFPAKAMDNAGKCSLKSEQHAEAEKYFLRAFKFDPGNIDVNFNLAKMYYERKDYEHAQFYIGRVIKSDVHDAEVLWMGIKVAHKMGDRVTESVIGSELGRFQPNSVQFASYQREAFDE
jgi:type IV pilus assembly protein PilF